jgi:hypothetical protein
MIVAKATTEHGPARPPRKRASKRLLRLMAWGAGAMSFATPWVALNLAPRPQAEAAPQPKPQVIVVHKVIKRVVWQQTAPASQPKVRYVYVSGGGGGSAPAAPAATTSGSHP